MSNQDKAAQKKKEITEMSVEDLLGESDSDDSDDDQLAGDPELEKFKQKAGIAKYAQSSQSQITTSTLQNELSSRLISDNQTKVDLPKSQSYTLKATLPKVQTKLTQDEKIKAALELELSSNSSSDEELDKILQQTSQSSNKQNNNNTSKTSKNDLSSTQSFIQGINGSNKNSGSAIIDNEGSGFSDLNKYKQNIASMDILDIIEKNERMNEVGPEKENEPANQLLSFDKKFYNIQKKLFTYQEYQDIGKKLHQQKNHQFGGIVSAISVIQEYIFVGNSSGIIRVFDTKTQREMKPLMDESTIGSNKVTSIDISDDGGFLISGYKKGQVALWDLVNYKLLKYINDIHQTDVINAKIYHIDESENLYAVSSEDSGRVQLIRYNKKNFLGGYSSEAQFLFKTRLKGTATISVQKNSIVSFGSLNEIVVCSMRPIKEIFQIYRPSFCKEKSVPYIDWGFGLTPSHREKTVPIMAFAWDRLIQLVYINEETSTVEMDGFYYSDQEINSLYFMGDSILFALINGREIKVLYTTKFYPGHFKFLENAKKDDLLNNQFEKVISVTSHAELEKGFEQGDIKSNLLQAQMVMNYNQSVKRYKSSIFFMCGKTIVRGKLFTWKEYLDHIKFKENFEWLTVLKVALEIYNGESKGFSKVPDEKEIREGILKGFMKDMIKESVQQVIYKYNNNSTQLTGGSNVNNNGNGSGVSSLLKSSSDNYQADSIAIKVAVEFCLSINATFFLFSDIYQIFQEQGLEAKFITNLEPFILSSQFKKEIIPEHIIHRIIRYYEEKRNYKELEKIVQQLDLTDYSQKPDLIIICEVNCLISALLYLMSSHGEESLGCMQILNKMLKVMTDAKNIEVSKEDIAMIQKYESMRKYEIEKSRSYIGFKLFWILKLFIDGRMYPTGYLTNEKHRIHVYDIMNFITNDYVLDELLQFDSEQFFKVVAKLFYGIPFKFLQDQRDYLIKNSIKGTQMSMNLSTVINVIFLKKCDNNEIRLENFYKFLITVQAQHEYTKPDSNPAPFLLIDQGLLLKAILAQINKRDQQQIIDEQTLIKAIQNKKYKNEDIDRMIQPLELQIRALPSLRIFLVERKKDYVQSFRLNMANTQLRKQIFEWINKILSKLSANGSTLQPFNLLKDAVQKSVRELIAINDSECVALLDRWFEDSYQEQLILEELADYPEIQFNYVKRFLNQNEEKIRTMIQEAAYSTDRKAEATRYIEYLVLHTKLLCKYQPDSVHEFVKKDYYPVTQCLEICKAAQIPLAIAELLKRNGDFLQSLKAYLEIIDSLDRQEMINELYQNQKSQTSQKTAAQKANNLEYLNCQKLPTIHEFDTLLDKAIKISEKQQSIVGEEGWFTILEFLARFRSEIMQKLYPQTISGGANLQLKTKEKNKVDSLKEFVGQRKNLVLRMVPTSISLQSLTERLKLDFKQIKELYDYKVKAVRNNEKYLKLAKGMQEKELNALQAQLYIQIHRGSQLEDDEKCQVCNLPLQLSIQKVPLRIFRCSHNYHLNCLKETICPLCVKQSIEIESKEQIRKNNRTGKGNKENSNKEEQKERNMAFMQAQAEAALAGVSPEKQATNAAGSSLFIKRLEVFDQLNENLGLSMSSFA